MLTDPINAQCRQSEQWLQSCGSKELQQLRNETPRLSFLTTVRFVTCWSVTDIHSDIVTRLRRFTHAAELCDQMIKCH